MKNRNWTVTVAAVVTALVASLVLVMSTQPAVYSFQKSQELNDNCKAYKLSDNVEKQIQIDIDEESVNVSSVKLRGEKYASPDELTTLPLKKTKNESEYYDCSVEAKNLLLEVQQVYEDYIAGSCKDFESVIRGGVPVPTKNGVKASVNAAKEFYDRYCVNYN